jgi:hypothetical protein
MKDTDVPFSTLEKTAKAVLKLIIAKMRTIAKDYMS